MTAIIIGVSFVLGILILFLMVVLYGVACSIRDKIRLDTANLFSDEYMPKEAEETLQEEMPKLKNHTPKTVESPLKETRVISLASSDYLDTEFLEGYYAIQNAFHFDVKEIVAIYQKNLVQESFIAKKISTLLNYDFIFKLSSLNADEQIDEIQRVLNDEQFQYFTTLYRIEGKDLFNTYQRLLEQAQIKAQHLSLRVSPYAETSNLPSDIAIYNDDSIAEGFQLIHHGKCIDYSIKRSELS